MVIVIHFFQTTLPIRVCHLLVLIHETKLHCFLNESNEKSETSVPKLNEFRRALTKLTKWLKTKAIKEIKTPGGPKEKQCPR